MITTEIADLHNARHCADFLNVLQSYAQDPQGGGTALSEDVLKRLIPALQERPDNTIVLLYVDDEIAGICNCFQGFSSFKAKPLLNIHDFAIVPEHRGKGLSKIMLDKAEDLAKKQGCCKLTLEVLEKNHRAKKVYEAFGFEGYELNPEMGKAVFWEKPL